jgi:hypothetical protein
MAPINFLSEEDSTRLKRISFRRSVVFSLDSVMKRPERPTNQHTMKKGWWKEKDSDKHDLQILNTENYPKKKTNKRRISAHKGKAVAVSHTTQAVLLRSVIEDRETYP